MGNKVLAILFLYWYWYGPYIYQQVLILVLVMLFLSPKIFNTYQQYFFKNSNIKSRSHWYWNNWNELLPLSSSICIWIKPGPDSGYCSQSSVKGFLCPHNIEKKCYHC